MAAPPPLAPAMITEASHLAAAVRDVAGSAMVALDTEANSFYAYPERICLVQMAAGDRVYLIDPLAVDDFGPLGELLADPKVEKVLHSAGYDLRSLDREWGFRVRGLFDTSIAAAFLGLPRLGLGTVLEEVLGVTIPKEKNLQRADWGRRPLGPEALAYAASDVRHLSALREALGERLRKLGRHEWVAEECARIEEVHYVAPDRTLAFLSIKGSRDLDGRGLAVLKELAAFRESEVLRLGRPPFRVMPDSALVALAREPNAVLTKVPGVGRYARAPLASRMTQALEKGKRDRSVRRPAPSEPSRPRPSKEEQDRLRALKKWRIEQGQRLGLDPALLWPASGLERLSRKPKDLDAELTAPEVRAWQRRELGASLRAFVGAMA